MPEKATAATEDMPLLRYLWALPNTLLGALLGLICLALGGRMRIVDGVMEFSGGRIGLALLKAPPSLRFSAITFGHVVLGVSRKELARVRAHEHVHVRQYERWGPLFIPAYLLSSAWEALRGRNPYLDNVFEREAYGRTQRRRRA
jgi:hypothetical protein